MRSWTQVENGSASAGPDRCDDVTDLACTENPLITPAIAVIFSRSQFFSAIRPEQGSLARFSLRVYLH